MQIKVAVKQFKQETGFLQRHSQCYLLCAEAILLQAMHVSFGMAEYYNGVCFLRFDDTNPEAEKQEYIDHIEDIVSWLGWKPYKA